MEQGGDSGSNRRGSSGRRIDFDEYESAYRRYLACMVSAGIEFVEGGLNEDGIFNYRVMDSENSAVAPDEECYQREFAQADIMWQNQLSSQTQVSRFAIVMQLLAERGIEVPAEVRTSGNTGAAVEIGVSIEGEDFLRRLFEKLENQTNKESDS